VTAIAARIRVSQEKETMLGTLYGRALASQAPHSLLHDEHAERLVRLIDYDFGKLGVNEMVATSVALRARQFDRWTTAFLTQHPDAVVVHLGCGLDSRVYRVDPLPTVSWFDIDYPEIIDLRRQVYPGRPGYTMIASNVLDPAWLTRIPVERPGLIVAEGLSMYLPPQHGPELFATVASHFPTGELTLDVQSPIAIKLQALNPVVRRTGSKLTWGVDDPHVFERAGPRLHLLENRRAFDLIDPDDTLPRLYRFTLWLMRRVPVLANLGLQLRYSF